MIRLQSPEDINALKLMLQQGIISNDDLNQMEIGGGYVATQPQSQPMTPNRKMRVVGYGNGQATDLGEEDMRATPIDYTRAGIDIPGIGKGHYSRDGRYAYVPGPEGMTKVVLGYDAEASDRRNDMQLKREFARSQLEQNQLQNEGLAQRNQMLAAGPGFSMGRGKAQAQDEGALPKMTEVQGKALSFGMRAANADAMLDLVGKGGEIQPGIIKRGAEGLPLVGDSLGTMMNWTQSDEQQQVERAQRDFINAILRRESGAVISPSEFANAAQQYFPQPNDGEAVKSDKRRARALAIAGLEQEVEPVRPGMIRGEATKARAIFDARAAIKKGAPKDAVIQRLKQIGLSELDL